MVVDEDADEFLLLLSGMIALARALVATAFS
jgi:hypothetical protein